MEAKKIILWLYYFSIGLMLVALPLSNYFMSVSQFCLVGVFILDGMKKDESDHFFKNHGLPATILLIIPVGLYWIFAAIARKFREFFRWINAPAWVFASIYLFHVLGLFFTTDFDFALKDLRIKLPILILPLILSTTNLLDRRSFRFMMYLFSAAVFTGTLISMYYYFTGNFTDSRELSRFISHIRFSLLIDITIFILAYQVLKKSEITKWPKIVMALIALWLIAFLIIVAYMTGLVILLVTAAVMILYFILMKKGWIMKVGVITGIVIIFIVGGLYILKIGHDVNHINPIDFGHLDKTTKLGNPYWNDTLNRQTENGNYVWIYISNDEMRQAWNKRSRYDFDGKDKAGQEIKYTLIRFLTSKGYRKDAEGVDKLTDKEVAMIEDGVASTVYVEKPNLYVRIYKIFWEYNRYRITHNASGHSVMQRIEFWKAAWAIIDANFYTGVGTGDLEHAFQDEYNRSGSLLQQEFRWRAHNQFLAIFATFGIVGFLWFLFSLIYPATRLGKFHDYYYLSFFIILMLSMLTEDTLETQAGVTIFAFFNSFYLFAKKFIDIV